MKYILFIISACLLTGCNDSDRTQDISDNTILENSIKDITATYATNIATLKAELLLTIMHETKNLIQSDDIYIEKNKVLLKYGFDIPRDGITVTNSGERYTLHVRIPKGKLVSINREKIETLSTHENYFPKVQTVDGKAGSFDADAVANKEIKRFETQCNEKNLKIAEDNLYKFFSVIAAKYNMSLDFRTVNE